MGAAYAIGLTLGGLNHEEDAAVVGQGLVQLEGEGLTLAHDGGAGRILHTQERGRGHLGLAAASDDPVIEAGEQVGAGDLGAGSEDTAALLAQGKLVTETLRFFNIS